MERQLIFERLIQYDLGQAGITLEVSLTLSAASVNFPAKVDTGASYCIFERRHGEALGLSIEIGRNVLGRHGWLDRVVLGLIDYEGKLLLSRYSL